MKKNDLKLLYPDINALEDIDYFNSASNEPSSSRIFYIDVGNLKHEDVEAYIKQITDKIKPHLSESKQ